MRFKLKGGTTRKLARYVDDNRAALNLLRVFCALVPIFAGVALFGATAYAAVHGIESHGGMVLALAATPAAVKKNANFKNLLTRLTRDQGPEVEPQSLTWVNNTTQSTVTSLRTDRKIKNILLKVRMRLTNGGTGPTLRTGSPLLPTAGATTGTQLFALVQLVTIRGQHLRYGTQSPIMMRGETLAEWVSLFNPNYVPQWTNSINGAAPVRNGALSATLSQTNDVEFVIPIPLFPMGIANSDQPFYSLHGPDWPGNLYIDVACGDGTALATANAPTITAYGSASGSGVINVYLERPLVSKELMAAMRPAVCFRTVSTQQPTAAVAAGGGSGTKLVDLIVGKDTTRIFLKAGTQAAGGSTGIVAYASYLDSICTNTYISLDNRSLRFGGTNGDLAAQDYVARSQGRNIPIGFKLIDFIASPDGGASPDNPKAAFQSSTLDASRQFQLLSDVVAASGQIAEVVQEMLLGAPQLKGAA